MPGYAGRHRSRIIQAGWRFSASCEDRYIPAGVLKLRRKGIVTAPIYELRLRSPVPADLLVELGVLSQVEEPAQTVLCTEVADQSALGGLLDRLRALGLDVIEIRRIPPHAGYGP